jgi:hypothetical protein
MEIRTMILLVSGILAVPCSALAQSTDHDGCTNATLRGDYAFRVSGSALLPMPSGNAWVDREGVAMGHFDGEGGFTQVDFVMSNGVAVSGPPDPLTHFHTGEIGWYKVNADCTGQAQIRFPAPPTFDSGAVIDVMFVLSERGRGIHMIVSQLVPPGLTTPVPVSIHSDGERLR